MIFRSLRLVFISVCLSLRPSVCLPVCHSYLLPFVCNAFITSLRQCLVNFTDPCAKKVCQPYARCKAIDFTRTECVCPKLSDCPSTRDEVCGSDRVTYNNDCALRVQACTRAEDITVDNLGPCGKI